MPVSIFGICSCFNADFAKDKWFMYCVEALWSFLVFTFTLSSAKTLYT